MSSCFKKPFGKYPESENAYLDRLQEYRVKLEETREIMNSVIREAVYRDAEVDINSKSLGIQSSMRRRGSMN